MASSPSKVKVRRQLPFTFTAQWSTSSPFNGWSFQPVIFISCGALAAFSKSNCLPSFASCSAAIPALEPVSKNCWRPLWRKLLIIPKCISMLYTLQINYFLYGALYRHVSGLKVCMQRTKAGECACEIRNPSGQCCLANFKHLEYEWHSVVGCLFEWWFFLGLRGFLRYRDKALWLFGFRALVSFWSIWGETA